MLFALFALETLAVYALVAYFTRRYSASTVQVGRSCRPTCCHVAMCNKHLGSVED